MFADTITVSIPDDIITVNNESCAVDLSAYKNLAYDIMSWSNGEGFTQMSPGIRVTTFEGTTHEYNDCVAPFVSLWKAAKARQDAEDAAAAAERNSPEARGERIRAERDRRLTACDYLMMPDYPLGEAERAAWVEYRQALRDLPEAEGFPWGGPDDPAVPWPVEPA